MTSNNIYLIQLAFVLLIIPVTKYKKDCISYKQFTYGLLVLLPFSIYLLLGYDFNNLNISEGLIQQKDYNIIFVKYYFLFLFIYIGQQVFIFPFSLSILSEKESFSYSYVLRKICINLILILFILKHVTYSGFTIYKIGLDLEKPLYALSILTILSGLSINLFNRSLIKLALSINIFTAGVSMALIVLGAQSSSVELMSSAVVLNLIALAVVLFFYWISKKARRNDYYAFFKERYI